MECSRCERRITLYTAVNGRPAASEDALCVACSLSLWILRLLPVWDSGVASAAVTVGQLRIQRPSVSREQMKHTTPLRASSTQSGLQFAGVHTS